MTTTATRTAYAELCEVARETATLSSTEFLLAWDQETYMPEAAADARASQRALIAGLVHDRHTSEQA